MPKGRSRKRKEKGHQSQPTGEWLVQSVLMERKIALILTRMTPHHTHTHTHPGLTHTPHTHTHTPASHTHAHTDTGSQDDDSESVCSSLDGSVMSEDGVGVAGVEEDTEEDTEFQLAEHIDRLGEKR